MIDPDILTFNRRLTQAWREHPPLEGLSMAEARAVAEQVRAPLTQGGPAMHATLDTTFTAAGETSRIRIHQPTAATSAPALIYLHGGGFTLFSIDTHDRLMREYAAQGSFTVIGVDYPLSPEAKFPVALDFIVALVEWLVTDGATWGIDPARMAIGGDSAGANLSVATCLRLRDHGKAPLRAMLLNYGAFSGDVSDEAETRLGGPDAVLNRAEMDYFYGNYLADPAQRSDPFASPIHADLAGLPPALLVIPDQDILAEQSVLMAERLAAAQVDVTSRIYPGATHSFLEAMASASLARQALDDGADWIARQLSR